jgi:cytosine/creatinine deaminase
MLAPLPFPNAASFPGDDYRLTNVSIPVCLLETKDGGNPASDTLAPATLTIADGKIRQISIGARAALAADSDLPAIDLDAGMIWPVCADLHTHIDKGHIWSRRPNTSCTRQDALTLVAKDRETNWTAEDVTARMDFALRCAFAHGTGAVRTHIDSMGAQSAISWPVLAQMRDCWPHRAARRFARDAGFLSRRRRRAARGSRR